MARTSKVVTITTGRDAGKHFRITEMPPRQAEKWATRALFAIAKNGGADERDAEEIASAGMAGLATVGLRSLTRMDFDDAEPLLDEMLSCIVLVPDPSKIVQETGAPFVRPVDWDNDIEDVATLLFLRSEVVEVHTGFSPAAVLSTLGAAAKAKLNGAVIGTSPKPSE